MGTRTATWKLTKIGSYLLEPLHLEPEPVSLDTATRLLPPGGYTTLRTYRGGYALNIEDHFKRLDETARLSGQYQFKIDWYRVRNELRRTIAEYPTDEQRIRIHLDLTANPGDLYVSIEPLSTPAPDDYKDGVRAVTLSMHRDNPKAKLTSFIDRAAKVRNDLPRGINEVLMVGEKGEVLEGLSSNFFGIRSGVIYTAEEGVLSGITRSMVLEVVGELGLELRLEPVAASDLGSIDEAFITSASRAVLPVTEIDGKQVGSGAPGNITVHLLDAYQRKVARMREKI